jgi:glyoxylase-like metal-dependent hydrolase (beta-lactamase superfamily II)
MTFSTPRRSFLKLGLVAGAALSTPQILTRTARAAVPMAGPAEQAFSRFTLGDFEVSVISDGSRTAPNPQSIFGRDQQPEAVSALLTENFLPADAIRFTFSPVLINTGEDLVLFDTGNGANGREGGAGRLLENISKAGYSSDQVSVVVISHMHPDHIGGLLEGGEPAFPNARYVAGKVEYDFWADKARQGTPAEGVHKLVMNNVVPFTDKMTFIGEGDTVVSGITGMEAFGHTPGHMVFHLESSGKRLMLTADTANHFVLSLQRPDWEVVFDSDKAAAAASRMKVFDTIAADRIPFIGYHMPFPAVGYVEKMDVGYRYVPETYQLDI